ncbi:YqkE family protein [Metabacillus sp. GX 13764]|uniref:YqkE family protein n=1 Tax=Metabacillus kandeliae TaxID=2900151 RepID=UPI001E574C19|nr:YqkE family protein [Metabacillus kandeliae]MCD7033276.1 YqkE family protein [Metabacillus kandeliae]
MKPKKQEKETILKDYLNQDLLKKLQSMKTDLKTEEAQKEEAARQAKLKELKEREKNKSFEELLNESDMNWKKFKQ